VSAAAATFGIRHCDWLRVRARAQKFLLAIVVALEIDIFGKSKVLCIFSYNQFNNWIIIERAGAAAAADISFLLAVAQKCLPTMVVGLKIDIFGKSEVLRIFWYKQFNNWINIGWAGAAAAADVLFEYC